jgi:hypothetical protein
MPDNPITLADRARQKAVTEIKLTFEQIAKTALRSAQECNDTNIQWMEKLRKGHTNITLIVDDAMRGLAKATEAAIYSVAIAATEDEESNDSQDGDDE